MRVIPALTQLASTSTTYLSIAALSSRAGLGPSSIDIIMKKDDTSYSCQRPYFYNKGTGWLGRSHLYFFYHDTFPTHLSLRLDYTRPSLAKVVDDEQIGKRSDCFCGTSGFDFYTRLHEARLHSRKEWRVSSLEFISWSLIIGLPCSQRLIT